MLIKEDFLDSVDSEDIKKQDDSDRHIKGYSKIEDCDMAMCISISAVFDELDYPSIKKFMNKIEKINDHTARLIAYTKPILISRSVFFLKSNGGPVPDDEIIIVDENDKDNYLNNFLPSFNNSRTFVIFAFKARFNSVVTSFGWMNTIMRQHSDANLFNIYFRLNNGEFASGANYGLTDNQVSRAYVVALNHSNDYQCQEGTFLAPTATLCHNVKGCFDTICDEFSFNPLESVQSKIEILFPNEAINQFGWSAKIKDGILSEIDTEKLLSDNDFVLTVKPVNMPAMEWNSNKGAIPTNYAEGIKTTNQIKSYKMFYSTYSQRLIFIAYLGAFDKDYGIVYNNNTYTVTFFYYEETGDMMLSRRDKFVEKLGSIFPKLDKEALTQAINKIITKLNSIAI